MSTTTTTTYKSQAAKDAQAMGYGDASYWAYLDEHAMELEAKSQTDALKRTLGEVLAGNDGQ